MIRRLFLAACLVAAPTMADVSQYDVIWDSPSADSSGSMPLGNGNVTLNVWTEPSGDVCFYIARGDRGVYVRLPDDADPNQADLDQAARFNHLLEVRGRHVHVRGLEIRNGASRQQQPLVLVSGTGSVIEGCLIRDGEVRGLGVNLFFDQSEAPIIARNNWILNMGNLGMGANASSRDLTPDNLDGDTPRRGRAVIEHNHVENGNWAAYSPMWESAGMKFFRLALPAAAFIRRFSYKSGVLLGLGLFAAGALMFYPASVTMQYGHFLVALFVLAGGLSILETSANPYVVALGP